MLLWLMVTACDKGSGEGGDTAPVGETPVGEYCTSDADCGPGRCEEVMCTQDCDGADFSSEGCPADSICHQGSCFLVCDTVDDCPLDTAPDTTGGYMCGGPNGDYSEGTYTCYLHPEDPGG
jgi:hypothetical protein